MEHKDKPQARIKDINLPNAPKPSRFDGMDPRTKARSYAVMKIAKYLAERRRWRNETFGNL